MNEIRPHLEIVRDGGETPAAGAAPEPSSDGRSGWLVWVLAGALLVTGVGWTLQLQRTAELETTLRATTAALVETRGRLEAYDGHLDRVKERTGGVLERASALTSEIEALSGLLEDGPLAPGADAPEPLQEP